MPTIITSCSRIIPFIITSLNSAKIISTRETIITPTIIFVQSTSSYRIHSVIPRTTCICCTSFTYWFTISLNCCGNTTSYRICSFIKYITMCFYYTFITSITKAISKNICTASYWISGIIKRITIVTRT